MEKIIITLTTDNREKLRGLSRRALMVATDVILDNVVQFTAAMARNAPEAGQIDWMDIVAGLPADADEIAIAVNRELAARELEVWLRPLPVVK